MCCDSQIPIEETSKFSQRKYLSSYSSMQVFLETFYKNRPLKFSTLFTFAEVSDERSRQRKKLRTSKWNDVLWNVISIARVIDQATSADADNRYRRGVSIRERRSSTPDALFLYFFLSPGQGITIFCNTRTATSQWLYLDENECFYKLAYHARYS